MRTAATALMLTMLAASGAILIPSSASAAGQSIMPELISDRAMDEMALEAAALSRPCEAELLAGPEGASCATYRQSMGRLNQTQIARWTWCKKRLMEGGLEPAGCMTNWGAKGRWAAIEALSRKRDPEHWRQIDALNQ